MLFLATEMRSVMHNHHKCDRKPDCFEIEEKYVESNVDDLE
jgi:hypothetical protein